LEDCFAHLLALLPGFPGLFFLTCRAVIADAGLYYAITCGVALETDMSGARRASPRLIASLPLALVTRELLGDEEMPAHLFLLLGATAPDLKLRTCGM
jgi:hypothetical protein